MSGSKIILHVEINQKEESCLNSYQIEAEVTSFLRDQDEIIPDTIYSDTVLTDHIAYFRITSNSSDEKFNLKLNYNNYFFRYYVYQCSSAAPQFDIDEQRDVSLSLNWSLPCVEFEGLWESLVINKELKNQLINYVQTVLLYSKNKVSSQIVKWNGIILLHGPPGTGKTSLCRALAQKLSIRLCSNYRSAQLIEINAHGLFSKWFSESPRLVMKIFREVRHILEYEEQFVCILLDEVETLTYARQISVKEPADSIRVVNAVLTELDRLQRFRNVLILGTSNITKTIDYAFADRADLKLYLGPPQKWAVYEILRSCIAELTRSRLLIGSTSEIFEANILRNLNLSENDGHSISEVVKNSNDLLDVSALCKGLSGRALRKIPFLTSVMFVDQPSPAISHFVSIMKQVVINYKTDNKTFLCGKACLSNGNEDSCACEDDIHFNLDN